MKIKRLSILIASISSVLFSAWSTYPAGYYKSLEGKSGKELRKAAKAIVASHTVVNYGTDTWEAFAKTDVRVVNGKEVWWDMYSNSEIPVSQGKPNSTVMNIEHSVANSWWGGTKNNAYKDLFHLNPSDSKANSAKGNYPLGEISGTPTYDNGVTFVGSPKTGMGGGCAKVYEPADIYKGDFARVFFYMFTVYDDISWKGTAATNSGVGRMYSVSGGEAELSQWAYEMMLRWAEEDAVSEKETDRNDAIYDIQHNRNPFIDLPHLARHIWGDLKTIPFHVESVEPTPDPDPDPDPTPDPKPDPTPDPEPANRILLQCDWESSDQISYYENLGWDNMVAEGSFSGWFIKEYQSNKYASASAYKGTGSGPYTAYLVSPLIEIPENGKTEISFRTQGAYGVSDSRLKVYICPGDRFDVSRLQELKAAICTPPASGSKPVYCDWVQSGNIDLSAFTGKNMIVWCYESGRNGSNTATYCLDDVKVTTDGTSVGMTSVDGGESAFTITDCGLTTSDYVEVYDITGRRVAVGEGAITLPRGLYIIVSANRNTAKILVK